MPEENSNAHDAVLAELYAKRDEIDTAISTILFLKGAGSTTPEASGRRIATANGGAIPSNAFFGLGIGDAAKKYLELIQAKRTLPQIVKALEDGGMPPQKPNTVYAAMRRRESVTGDIMRVGEEWGLREWFSNIPKPKPAKTTKGRKSKKRSAKKAASKTPAAITKATTAEKKVVSITERQQPKEAEPPPKETKTTKPIKNVDAVFEILTKADIPLHADALVEKLKQDYGKTTNVKSIAASLPDDSTGRFENIGGNTWVLTEWPESKKVKAATATA
ncbi:MAG: hypothetical protein V7638_670 [Acidobacteriota bacterium]|jgi:hypothetical protein